jgi:hypothetical protein
MEGLEAAGGDLEGTAARQTNQGKRAATRRRRERDDGVGEQLGLDRRRYARSSR